MTSPRWNRHNCSPGLLLLAKDRTGLPRSGKKVWKIKKFPGQGKVREFQFWSGKFRKNDKSQGKAREFEKFQKKLIGKKVLKIKISIN